MRETHSGGAKEALARLETDRVASRLLITTPPIPWAARCAIIEEVSFG